MKWQYTPFYISMSEGLYYLLIYKNLHANYILFGTSINYLSLYLSMKISTIMTTFIKTKFKISDDKTNIYKYRLAANITEYRNISKLILQRIINTNFCGSGSHLR